MVEPTRATLRYYSAHGLQSDPRYHAELLDALPQSLDALCGCVQGLVIHRNWGEAYGVKLLPERGGDAQARAVSRILDRVLELDERPLAEPREPLSRFAGTCRDFALLLCAILRHREIPARARCGFGTYFLPGRFEDHWICEHWDADARRWVQTDAQIDSVQRDALKLDFDPLDLPAGRFVVAGRAWQRCRAGETDPAHFGIFDMRGLGFVRGNVLRDLAALNRMELLPWDDWGLSLRLGDGVAPDDDDARLIDRAAATSCEQADSIDVVRGLYEGEPELRVPGRVRNWQTAADELVAAG